MKNINNKHRKILLSTLVFVISIIMFSCTEKIDIKLDESYTRLVVEGYITADSTPDFVKLTTTSSYFANQPPDAVSDAEVYVISDEDTVQFFETEAGYYVPAIEMNNSIGKKYRLRIHLKDEIGGFVDYDAEDFMKPVNPVDSIQVVFHQEWGRMGMWEVKSYVLEPEGSDYYRFMIQKNSQILTDSLDEWFISDDKFFDGNYSNGAGVGFLNQSNPSESLKSGDTVWLRVDNISPKFTYFIWTAQAEISGSNPMFSGPPANVKGNISNGAIGFFAAYASSYAYDIIE